VRDIALIASVAGICAYALIHPWVGIMGWTLLSIMNLHRYGWQSSNLPLAAAIAIATLLGVLFTKDRRSGIIAPASIALIIFMGWMCLTLPFSFDIVGSYDMWKRVMKIDFMILVAIAVLHSRQHITSLIWVLVLSLGFYGFKGGIFTVVQGGAFRVWGPEGSFIEGNNELALAMILTIPLMRFLQIQSRNVAGRIGMMMLMILTAAAALGTQSRGALLAIVAMALMMWWRNQNKVLIGGLMIIVGLGLVAVMPSTWDDRMATITQYETDGSAMGRINAWWMAWNLAKDRLLGGGFDIYTPSIFGSYAPNPTDIHAAHSIYFQVLGEHGFVGLLLFLLIWVLVWRSAAFLRKQGAADPQVSWARDLGSMCQVSLVGYLVGGAFLSLAYFDLPYNLLVLMVVTERLVREHARGPAVSDVRHTELLRRPLQQLQ
jgi:probable O-glycosylation ligase (exosortase A-associated)